MDERQKLTDSNWWEFLPPEQWGGDANTLTPEGSLPLETQIYSQL